MPTVLFSTLKKHMIWLWASSKFVSEQTNILPVLFFVALCSTYWSRWWLPRHHRQTATGSSVERSQRLEVTLTVTLPVTTFLNLRAKIHRNESVGLFYCACWSTIHHFYFISIDRFYLCCFTSIFLVKFTNSTLKFQILKKSTPPLLHYKPGWDIPLQSPGNWPQGRRKCRVQRLKNTRVNVTMAKNINV